MGNRTTTLCDAAGCTAEQENPRMVGQLQLQPVGWGKLLTSDVKTGFPSSYDLCPTHVDQIIKQLGLPNQQQAMYTPTLSPTPTLKTCEKCTQPYVGESCYFCEIAK
jgi:hypothetical protein